MKVKFTGKTNKHFAHGMIYEAIKSQTGNFPVSILHNGNKVADIINPIFNSDFEEYSEVIERAKYTSADSTYFKYGKEYEFIRDIDSVERDFVYVICNTVKVAVDMQFFNSCFNIIKPKEPKAEKKQYMVSVAGSQAPKKVHDCPVLAEQEAVRLCKQPRNIGKEVTILQVVKTLKSRVRVREMKSV